MALDDGRVSHKAGTSDSTACDRATSGSVVFNLSFPLAIEWMERLLGLMTSQYIALSQVYDEATAHTSNIWSKATMDAREMHVGMTSTQTLSLSHVTADHARNAA